MVVILHNIRSLHNVGSIFRTADAVGVEKIYLCGITPAPIDVYGKFMPQFKKVSLGAEKYVKWERMGRTIPLIKRLKNHRFKIFAVEQSKEAIPYYKMNVKDLDEPKTALVLGSEARGLPQSILKLADRILEIPMVGKKESLNVSVAFGVAAYSMFYGGK